MTRKANTLAEWAAFVSVTGASAAGYLLGVHEIVLPVMSASNLVLLGTLSPFRTYSALMKSILGRQCTSHEIFRYSSFAVSASLVWMFIPVQVLAFHFRNPALDFIALSGTAVYYFVSGLRRAQNLFPILSRKMAEEVFAAQELGREIEPPVPVDGPKEAPDIKMFVRIREYFTTFKPYLDHELTLEQVSTALYTNKNYISKSIRDSTGQNFCQFVNNYRVMHSIDIFKNNPGMRVSQLAELSGFNTTATFNMAFKMIMHTSPSQWCHNYRAMHPVREITDSVP